MQQSRIIIDFAHDTPRTRGDLVRHITNLQQHYNNTAIIEVIAYGEGLGLLLEAEGIADAALTLQASFVACQNTMKRKHIEGDTLIAGAQTTVSGLGHIVDRQLDGWAYIKE